MTGGDIRQPDSASVSPQGAADGDEVCPENPILPLDNVYFRLTRAFNKGRKRAVITSGQAVVLYRLAVMSKDGDWVLREDEDALQHVLATLAEHGARYRFGAPLDLRWLREGWSSHFEFNEVGFRVRTDFFTRPPRVGTDALERLWHASGKTCEDDLPRIDLIDLVRTKMTIRERDYAVIGELARLMTDPRDQLLYSRSARDLIALAEEYETLVKELSSQRPVLKNIDAGRDALEQALDAERRMLMRQDEERLDAYEKASERWRGRWVEFNRSIADIPLLQAHERMTSEAEKYLPFVPSAGSEL